MSVKVLFTRAVAGRALLIPGVVLSLCMTGCSDSSNGRSSAPVEPPTPTIEDRAYYILPPGNYGGLPTSENSLDLLDAWVADDAPRLDADDDGFYDVAGPTIMDALFGPLAAEVMRPVFGDLTEALDGIRDLGGNPDSASGSVGSPPGASFIDKDLRTLLGKEVEGKFNLQYCGNGSVEDCRDSLWQVVEVVSQQLAQERGDDPSTWLREGHRISFAPGLIPETFRATNRPTFQQLLEFAPPSPADN